MAKTLVFVEQREGKLKKTSFELLGAAAAAGHEVHAVLIGSGVAGLAEGLGAYGATKVWVVDDAQLRYYTPEAYTKVLLGLVQKIGPRFILASHTPMG